MHEFRRFWYGVLYFWLWNCSIFGGYIIFFCPLLPLLFLIPKLYRRIADLIVTQWQFYVTILQKVLWGCKVQVIGDHLSSDETAILISNHRTRVDWNFLWPAMYHAVEGKNKMSYSTKFVLKDIIKNYPGAGWVMQLAFYMFIKRNWERDIFIIQDYIDYVADMVYKHILILFPEGTDLTPETKASSDKYAKTNGLQTYKHVLHPRTTGFMYLVDEMKRRECIDAIYDVTLIYPDACPQNEEQLFFTGQFPKTVIVHLVRYPIMSLPNTKEGLKAFLENRWLEKEHLIKEFRTTGHLPEGRILARKIAPVVVLGTFIFWSVLPCVAFCLLVHYKYFLYCFISHTILLLWLNFLPSGWQNLDIIAYKMKRFFLGKRKYEKV